MNIHIKSWGQRAGLICIFFVFLLYGLSMTQWEGAYIQEWEKLDVDFNSAERNTEAPYLKVLDDINDDNYFETLIYDGLEKSIGINDSISYQTLVNPHEIYNESIAILNATEYFKYYGNSSVAVYDLKGGADQPALQWHITLAEYDIMKCEVIDDVNGDGVKDIFVASARLNQLPDPTEFDYKDTAKLFMDNHWLFEEFFIVDKYNTTMLVTPKYEEYGFFIIGGKTGNVIKRSDVEELELERCIIDFVELNRTGDLDDINQLTHYVLLTCNISLPRLQSPIGQALYDEGYPYNFAIHGLSIDPMEFKWEKHPGALSDDDQFYVPSEYLGGMTYMSANTSLKYARAAEIEGSGENFILKFFSKNGTVFDGFSSDEWAGIPDNTYMMVYNGTDGSNQWNGELGVEYLTKNIDVNGDGFGQFNGFYTNDTDIYFTLYNDTDGNAVCKAKLEYNASRLINFDCMDYMRLILSDDDVMGNDGYFEIYIVGLNKTYYNKWLPGSTAPGYESDDPIQIARINLNHTGNISMWISPIIENSNINLKGGIWAGGWYIAPTGVDWDQDDIKDYLLHSDDKQLRITEETQFIAPRTAVISGAGIRMQPRMLDASFSAYVEPRYGEFEFDMRKIDEIVHFFVDPRNDRRISSISSNPYELIYVQDINTFQPAMTFMEFFEGGSYIIYGLLGCLALCGIIFISSIRMKSREEDETEDGNMTKTLKISIILALIIISLITYFFTSSIRLIIGYTDVTVSAEGQLIWFLILYPSIFVMMALIPWLFNKSAPFFAEKVFIDSQMKLYNIFVKRKMKDYKVIIVNMENKDKVSSVTRLSRLLLPLLISLTIGITIYQGLGETGSIYTAFQGTLIDHPLTNPSVLGVITKDMTTVNDVWIEIGKFARYCVLPMIITYLFISIIIPGSWLLDDAGVCYYEKALQYREISDVDSISKWMLGFVSGLFGFTAITSFFSLFSPMLGSLGSLAQGISILSDDNPFFGISVLILALIVFPVLLGVLLMFSSMQLMEKNYYKNVERLYNRMESKGISTVPHPITAVIETELPDAHFLKDYHKKTGVQLESRDTSNEMETSSEDINIPKVKKVDFEDKYDKYFDKEE
ncbi:MAG: hypothetical protein GF364_05575 [Candidatus Lokiarchaeota archaeon]|nr:hypothetical protein [Candidatus Lokiarchaeota archaeon]